MFSYLYTKIDGYKANLKQAKARAELLFNNIIFK